MGLEQVVNVAISRVTAGITQAGFGIPCIFGPNVATPGVQSASSLAALAEMFTTSDPEYVMGAKMFSQTPRPPTIKFFKRTAAVAQVNTVTPNVAVQAVFAYVVTINGTVYSFTGDADPTATEIVTGLKALINADSACVVTASGTSTLILTADNAGQPFTCELGARLTQVATTASNGIADDIASAIDSDNDWYFMLMTSVVEHEVLTAAATIEALRKMFCYLSSDATVRSSVTTDIASVLKAALYYRTFISYSGTPAERSDAAFVGRVAPLSPGSETWFGKTMAGVTKDAWTDTEQTRLNTKNVNYYLELGGKNITFNGKTAGGEFIDVIRFIDWLQARMQEQVFGDITSLDKLPFTDNGISVIDLGMRAVLERGVAAGGIASSNDYTVTVPKSKDIYANDKAARKMISPNCPKFTAVLAGAIHATDIGGEVTL